MKTDRMLIGYLGNGLLLAMIVGATVLAAKWYQEPPQRPIETTWRYVTMIDGKPVECVRHVDHVHNVSTHSC